MRNTLLKKYFSYFIILINNKLSKNNENMRNAFLISGSTSPYGDSSFPKEENGEYYRLSNYC